MLPTDIESSSDSSPVTHSTQVGLSSKEMIGVSSKNVLNDRRNKPAKKERRKRKKGGFFCLFSCTRKDISDTVIDMGPVADSPVPSLDCKKEIPAFAAIENCLQMLEHSDFERKKEGFEELIRLVKSNESFSNNSPSVPGSHAIVFGEYESVASRLRKVLMKGFGSVENFEGIKNIDTDSIEYGVKDSVFTVPPLESMSTCSFSTDFSEDPSDSGLTQIDAAQDIVDCLDQIFSNNKGYEDRLREILEDKYFEGLESPTSAASDSFAMSDYPEPASNNPTALANDPEEEPSQDNDSENDLTNEAANEEIEEQASDPEDDLENEPLNDEGNAVADDDALDEAANETIEGTPTESAGEVTEKVAHEVAHEIAEDTPDDPTEEPTGESRGDTVDEPASDPVNDSANDSANEDAADKDSRKEHWKDLYLRSMLVVASSLEQISADKTTLSIDFSSDFWTIIVKSLLHNIEKEDCNIEIVELSLKCFRLLYAIDPRTVEPLLTYSLLPFLASVQDQGDLNDTTVIRKEKEFLMSEIVGSQTEAWC